MLREIRLNESSEKTRVFLHMAIRKQTAQGLCFMNEQQPNSKNIKIVRNDRAVKHDCCD